MTTKEDAMDLIAKFENEIGQSDFHIPEFISGVECADGSYEYGRILDDETRDLAKQCALICISESIKELKTCEKFYENNSYYGLRINFLNKVKEEIKKV